MKKHQPGNIEEINSLIKDLNFFHDGSIKKVIFSKTREIDEDGNLCYSSEDVIGGHIKIEVLLNTYQGAKFDQIVILNFQNVRRFNFYQNEDFDYSDVYEVKVDLDKEFLKFSFYSTEKKIKSLEITSGEFVCIEE